MSRHPLHSTINIVGLAVGLAAAFVILMHVRHETSFDGFWPGADRVYRVEAVAKSPDGGTVWSRTFGAVKEPFENYFAAETTAVTRIWDTSAGVRQGDRFFREDVMLVDESFADVFALDMIRGDADSVLSDVTTLMLSQSAAEKYFGDSDPMGRELVFDDVTTYRIAGVFRDLPDNTHLTLDLVARINPATAGQRSFMLEEWNNLNLFLYFRLRDGVELSSIESRMEPFISDRFPRAIFDTPVEDPNEIIGQRITPLTDIHLKAGARADFKPSGDIDDVYMFLSIAALILAIAAINFINLSTARAVDRAREMGLRKVMGATRRNLFVQFLSESFLFAFAALALALLAIELSSPWIESFMGYEPSESSAGRTGPVIFAVALTAILGFGAGIYPALLLSRFSPARVLRSSERSAPGAGGFRMLLVAGQFAITIGLLASAAVVYSQDRFARTLSLGYETAQKVVLETNYDERVTALADTLRAQFTSIPGVRGVTFAGDSLPLRSSNIFRVNRAEQGLEGTILYDTVGVDQYFFDVMQIEPISGRVFGPQYGSDAITSSPDESLSFTANIVLNRAGAAAAGFSDPLTAVGQVIRTSLESGQFAELNVVGIIPDIHVRGVDFEVRPTMFHINPANIGYIFIDVDPGNLTQTLAAIDSAWARVVPMLPLSRWFMDEDFGQLYESISRRAILLGLFAALAIGVACLGLYGLAHYTAERRTREIGLRKVLGAEVRDIAKLLIWQFSKPVAWAGVIALPASWWLASDWLSGFAYRIDLGIEYFGLAGIAAVAIAWLTVGGIALRVGRTKPAVALRCE